jgi:hypothetical protein
LTTHRGISIHFNTKLEHYSTNLKARRSLFWRAFPKRGRQDLNPRHSVLETDVLPLNYYPVCNGYYTLFFTPLSSGGTTGRRPPDGSLRITDARWNAVGKEMVIELGRRCRIFWRRQPFAGEFCAFEGRSDTTVSLRHVAPLFSLPEIELPQEAHQEVIVAEHPLAGHQISRGGLDIGTREQSEIGEKLP